MYNCGLLKFRKLSSKSSNEFGALTPIEAPGEIPFEVKRLYYIYNVQDGIEIDYSNGESKLKSA